MNAARIIGEAKPTKRPLYREATIVEEPEVRDGDIQVQSRDSANQKLPSIFDNDLGAMPSSRDLHSNENNENNEWTYI